MISKINVQKFGLFENYLWDTTIGRDDSFKKLNIIYGRNYSGKTTLSRIFRCIELGQLHQDYNDCNFKLILEDRTEITHQNFQTFNNKVRVYNSDFVRDNLNWLHNDDGTIKPFTILGAVNVELEKRIQEIDEELGNIEEEKGLRYDKTVVAGEVKIKGDALKGKKDSLSKRLTDKAREVKNKANVYNLPTYSITHIKNDIDDINEKSILSDDDFVAFNKLLKEEAKLAITKLVESKPGFAGFYSKVKELVEKSITLSNPITALLNDAVLQEWVRSGIDLHRGLQTSCGFCGGTLPKDLWDKLDKHFSKESEKLRQDIEAQKATINKSKSGLAAFLTIKKEAFYNEFHKDLEKLLLDWEAETKAYNQNLDELITTLEEREKDIFKVKTVAAIEDNSQKITDILITFNQLIDKNNERATSLSGDQKKARNALRISEVAKFIRDIEYDKLNDDIDKSQTEHDEQFPEIAKVVKKITDLEEEKRILENESKDESRGAELVNNHLSHFFGHDELKLVAIDEDNGVKFKITRGTSNAKNLSEGESSLISFCYFIAKIQDEIKEDANVNQLILYVDDPISSLDSNHIFFMFSLIESVITKPQKYNQLFISTHNLDFLKYLKKLTIPKVKAQPDSKAKESIAHLMIERKSSNHSVIRIAPDYLKAYITEFNYLFEQMYKCAQEGVAGMDHNYQYNFGNNARKFLESYLYYKYPSHKVTNDKRLEMFFENETVTISLIRRVINEYSHLENQFDRAMEPIDEDVIKKVAQAIMNKIEASDPEQYRSLVESIAA
jgi:wobble nucleotide-excising tRNase